MKILKIILIIVLVIIAVPLILGLFVEKEFQIERNIVIDRPVEEVFAHIRSLKNQDKFSVWAQKDLGMNINYSGDDGEVGSVSAWDSENDEVGKGSQEIKNIIENERIDTKLKFLEPFESEMQAYMATEPEPNSSTKVSWGFSGEFAYPTNAMLLFMDMEEEIGKDLEEGLQNLKKTLEN